MPAVDIDQAVMKIKGLAVWGRAGNLAPIADLDGDFRPFTCAKRTSSIQPLIPN